MNPISLQRQAPRGNPATSGYPAGGPQQQYGMPGQMPGQQMPMGQQMPGQMMGQQMPGQMGQSMPGQQMPGQMMGQQMPGQQMPGQMMGQMPGQQMPGQMMGQQMPGQQMPGQMMGQQMPGQMMGQQMPGQQMPGQQMPGQQMPGQQMPGQQMPGQQMPGQMMGQQMPGQMMGQVGMNPPINSMPGQMGMGGPGAISLVKGQNMSLTKAAPSMMHALIGLGWDVRRTPGAPFDLDASCFLLNAQNRISSPQNFIFYNNKQSMDGCVVHQGDNLTGAGEGDDEQIYIDLTRVSPDVQSIMFLASIYEAEMRGQNFGMVQRAFIRVVDRDTNQEVVRYDLTEEACMLSCMQFGELYRHGGEWKFKAHGEGIQGGLKAAGAQFGMQLA